MTYRFFVIIKICLFEVNWAQLNIKFASIFVIKKNEIKYKIFHVLIKIYARIYIRKSVI